MSRNAQPHSTTAPTAEDPDEPVAPESVQVDPAALRATVAVLERDLAAREAQVSALHEQYETVLAERELAADRQRVREARTDGGVVGRVRRALEK
ncbi:hypothetical protein [Haloarchaeobius sp. HRN-SO-5]|uniref:hypothetical protein n=1 Tax=Haloarchaeobius sp. HRN-SO-5 TaxID=3446118 RepID=UPI003EB8CC30